MIVVHSTTISVVDLVRHPGLLLYYSQQSSTVYSYSQYFEVLAVAASYTHNTSYTL